jgi:hypothetical protein
MVEVVEAKHIEKYIIWLKFNNGVSGKADLENDLWGSVFEPLKNIDTFKRFTVSKELGTIVWENEADFAPEFLLDKVLSS